MMKVEMSCALAQKRLVKESMLKLLKTNGSKLNGQIELASRTFVIN